MPNNATGLADRSAAETGDRAFDYNQHVLVAVELGATPSAIGGTPDGCTVFRRLSIPELLRAASAFQPAAAPGPSPDFEHVLAQHMGYWEQRIPAGQQCFVHYAIGSQAAIAGLFDQFASEPARWAMAGTYHLEPQSSCYPFGFPATAVPDNYRLGEAKGFTEDSVFWFNFFPTQPYLFEKTFLVWTRFCAAQMDERGECNQLVASDGPARLLANGLDEFVQVNLNRFTSLRGFLASARGAGETTFTVDADYRWYGMLLRKL